MLTPLAISTTARRRAAPPVVSLNLTWRQRQAMLGARRLSVRFFDRLESLSGGDQTVAFTREESDRLADELSDAALEASEPDRKQLAVVLDALDELIDSIERDANAELSRRQACPVAKSLLQFKVTLLGLEPAVWRRFQIEDGPLSDLHAAIQGAFGWRSRRQYRFIIAGRVYSRPPVHDFGFGWNSDCIADSTAQLSALAPRSGRRARWIYEYDFRDAWRHEVLFEGYRPVEQERAYPVCLQGENACPPEGIGGLPGYVEFLQTLEAAIDPNGRRVAESAEVFDPERFDAEETSRAMQRFAPLTVKIAGDRSDRPRNDDFRILSGAAHELD